MSREPFTPAVHTSFANLCHQPGPTPAQPLAYGWQTHTMRTLSQGNSSGEHILYSLTVAGISCIAFYEMSLMLPNWLQYGIWFWCSAHACSQYIISFSPSLSLSLGIRSLYIKRHQTVVSQLCLQVLSRLSGQNAEDPSIQVFLPGGLMYGLNHARCSGVSSIQDPGQSSFSAKKVVHQWLRGMGQRVGHANYESWFQSCTGGWRMSCIKCMLTQRRIKRWRHVIDQYWSYILVPCSCVCCYIFFVYAGIGICVTSVFMHVSFSPEGEN